MGEEEKDKKTAQIETDGGAFVNGSVDTHGGDFVGRDQWTVNNFFQQVVLRPAAWQDAIWGFIKKDWAGILAALAIQITLALLYLEFKDLHLIPFWAWGIAAVLALLATSGWYAYLRVGRTKNVLYLSLGATALLAIVLSWQTWLIVSPARFPPLTFGIAVAEIGEGPDSKRTSRAREISRQIFAHLDEAIAREFTLELTDDPEGAIELRGIGVIPDSQTAKRLGGKIQADIVLWGQILTSKENSATILFEILETPDRAINPEFPLILPVSTTSAEVFVRELDMESDPQLMKQVIAQQTTIISSYALGLQAYLNRNYPDAIKHIETAIDALDQSEHLSSSAQGRSLLYYYLGKSYQGMGHIETGQELLKQAQSENPGEPAIPLSLAIGYGSLGKEADRDEYLEQAYQEINAWLETHLNDPTATFDRGVIHHIREQYDFAVLDYEAVLEQDPEFYIAYINLAQANAKLGNFDQAEQTLQSAIALAEEKGINPSWSYLNLAIVHDEAGDLEAARGAYQESVDRSPNDAWFHYYFARFLEKIEEPDAALSEYQQVAEIAASKGIGKSWAFGNLAGIYQRIGIMDKARENYVRAVHARPEDAMLHTRLAEVYFAMGKSEDAFHEFEEAISLDDQLYFTFASYAGALFQTGDFEKAAQMYEKSLELRPIDCPVMLNLGQTYGNLDQDEKARELYNQVTGLSEHCSEQIIQAAQERLDALGAIEP